MFSDEHLYSIALRKCGLIGNANFKKLIDAAGSAKNVWEFSKKEIQSVFRIGEQTAKEIGNENNLKFAEKELEFCHKNGIKILLRHQNELPKLLDECSDAPAILYQKGNPDLTKNPVSIVGTRNITAYGKTFVEDFLEALKNRNVVTVSGLALGVDSEVHKQSIERNIPTIGILAHGFHTLYPSKNRFLAEKIIDQGGALFTEFNSSQKPDREHFIQRNRIIAGISPSTIVVESALGGGSMSTVTFANSYNRNVFALPGRVTDQYSQGCNNIIHQNKASTISTIPDLIRDLQLDKTNELIPELFPRSEIKPQLTDVQSLIYKTIKEHPLISMDEISEKTDIPAYQILPILLEIELSGYIRTFSGRQFQAI